MRLRRRTEEPRAADRDFRRAVALLTLTLFAVLALWATLTPPFSTVDEPRHFNSVLRVAQGGGWPPPQTAPMLEGSTRAAAEAAADVAPQDRSSALALDAPDYDTANPDWMTQHPPTYYALNAGAVMTVDLLTPGEQRWDQSLLIMRLFSVALTAASLPFVARSLRLVTGSVPASLVGAATFLLIPQLLNTHSLVTNDAMITFLGSVMTYAGIRALTRPETLLSSSVLGGVALGVGLLTKGLMLPAVPVLALFLLLAGWRAGRSWVSRVWIPLLGGVIAFAIGGWWWVRNIVVYGQIQSSNNEGARAAEPFDGYSLSGFVVQALTRLNQTFWASIRPPVGYDTWIPAVLSVLAILVVLTALVLSRHRWILLLTIVYPTLVTGLFTYNAWRIFWNQDFIAGIQGRYLYSGLTFLALGLALFWQELAKRLGHLTGVVVAGAVMLGTCVTLIAGYVYAFGIHWAGQSDSRLDGYTAMVEASALPVWLHVTLVALTAVVGLAAAVTVVRSAATREPVVATTA